MNDSEAQERADLRTLWVEAGVTGVGEPPPRRRRDYDDEPPPNPAPYEPWRYPTRDT